MMVNGLYYPEPPKCGWGHRWLRTLSHLGLSVAILAVAIAALWVLAAIHDVGLQ